MATCGACSGTGSYEVWIKDKNGIITGSQRVTCGACSGTGQQPGGR